MNFFNFFSFYCVSFSHFVYLLIDINICKRDNLLWNILFLEKTWNVFKHHIIFFSINIILHRQLLGFSNGTFTIHLNCEIDENHFINFWKCLLCFWHILCAVFVWVDGIVCVCVLIVLCKSAPPSTINSCTNIIRCNINAS